MQNQAPVRSVRSSLAMKQQNYVENKVKNYARKLKRKLRTAATAEAFSQVYAPEFEEYLKTQASQGIYDNIFKLLHEKARQLKVEVKKDFAIKPKIVLPNIVDTAASAGNFATLLQAATAAGLAGSLANEKYFTVFAPTDEAFAKLAPGTVEALLADIPKLQTVLKHHVLAGPLWSKKLIKAKDSTLKTLQGTELAVKVNKDEEVTIEKAKVVQLGIKCGNGIIHTIDSVLMPPEPKE